MIKKSIFILDIGLTLIEKEVVKGNICAGDFERQMASFIACFDLLERLYREELIKEMAGVE